MGQRFSLLGQAPRGSLTWSPLSPRERGQLHRHLPRSQEPGAGRICPNPGAQGPRTYASLLRDAQEGSAWVSGPSLAHSPPGDNFEQWLPLPPLALSLATTVALTVTVEWPHLSEHSAAWSRRPPATLQPAMHQMFSPSGKDQAG